MSDWFPATREAAECWPEQRNPVIKSADGQLRVSEVNGLGGEINKQLYSLRTAIKSAMQFYTVRGIKRSSLSILQLRYFSLFGSRFHWLCLRGAFSGPRVAVLEIEAVGAAGGDQHWSCQTVGGGCIRSSSPSSGVNCRTGIFTQPLTWALTSEVMIKVRGRRGPLWSASSQAPPATSSSSLYFTLGFFFFLSLFCYFPHHLRVCPSVCLSRTLILTSWAQVSHLISWEGEKKQPKKNQ